MSKSERLKQIEALFHEAQKLEKKARSAFLDAACTDAGIRFEVESRLKANEGDNSFRAIQPQTQLAGSSSPEATAAIVDPRATLLPGHVLSNRYEILVPPSKGGMGEVYKAKDLELPRFVAIKVLPVRLGRQPDFLKRFKREADAISTLNHPHICTLYDKQQDGEILYLVLEYIDGETLRRRFERPMTAQEFMRIAVQCLEALEAAHAKNILHRDIKPENIMLDSRGGIKFCDFGLAKWLPAPNAPTPTAITESVESVWGTLGYSAPEVLTSGTVEQRSDLFSLGIVFYEALAGHNPFLGSSVSSTRYRTLNEKPHPLPQLNRTVPKPLSKIIGKMMEKDPDNRPASATATLKELQELESGQQRRLPLPTAVTIGLIIFASLALVIRILEMRRSGSLSSDDGGIHTASIQNSTFEQLTHESGPEISPTLSPDGKSIVYSGRSSGNWDLYTLRVGGKNSINLTKDSIADDKQPEYSPDGEYIAFRSDRNGGGIFVMGATGESVRRVTNFGFNPSWSPDGKQLVFADESVDENPNNRLHTSALWIVDVQSGERKQISKGDAVQPNWSPHGRRIAYWAVRAGNRDIWTIRPDGTDVVPLTNDASLDWNPVWSPDGRYIYFSSDRGGNGNLWRVSIDEASGKPSGTPEPVTVGGGLAQRQHPSLSHDGRLLAYVEQLMTANIHKIPFDASSGKTFGSPTSVTQGSRDVRNPDVSKDGKFVTFQSWGKQEDIFVIGVDGTGERQLTNDIYKDRVPRWSPDQKRIVFFSNRTGNFELWSINPDGGDLRQITHDASVEVLRGVWSPDGKRLAAFDRIHGTFLLDLFKEKTPRETLPDLDAESVFNVWSWSPDGRFLAGHRRSKSSGDSKGLVLFSLDTKRYEKVLESGTLPTWAGNDKLIFENDGALHLLDLKSKQTREVLSPNPSSVTSFAFDNQSLYLTLTSWEADIWLINLR